MPAWAGQLTKSQIQNVTEFSSLRHQQGHPAASASARPWTVSTFSQAEPSPLAAVTQLVSDLCGSAEPAGSALDAVPVLSNVTYRDAVMHASPRVGTRIYEKQSTAGGL